ncbi:hypothetical protein LTR85_000734 [Meristemomyces frigidus]|nr:hypothetical protein LTR85_000734 [Meristemomyces frigidus]
MDHPKNLTVQMPPSATLLDNRRVLCVAGSPWKEALLVVVFFATNYFAHAATVKSTPGDTTTITVRNIVLAVVFPMSGLMRALNAIARMARFGASEIENACRAGALCMVVRSSDWTPKEGDAVKATVVKYKQQDMPDNEEGDDDVTAEGTMANLVTYLPGCAREDTSSWAFFDTIGSRAFVDKNLTRIHGSFWLPQGYTFAIVPRDAIFTTPRIHRTLT